MADVTGPISSMPGSLHTVPQGMMCDDCSTKLATVRVQGETDSMGCEMADLCDDCYRKQLVVVKEHAAEARTGKCDWCKNNATDLRDARDYEEGLSGRLYRVCGPCIKKRDAEAQSYLDDVTYDWDC